MAVDHGAVRIGDVGLIQLVGDFERQAAAGEIKKFANE